MQRVGTMRPYQVANSEVGTLYKPVWELLDDAGMLVRVEECDGLWDLKSAKEPVRGVPQS